MDASFWHKHIAQYEKTFGTWEKRADGIVKRYKDERDRNKTAARYNILWSNIQTLAPAVYDNPPKPNIERRRKDYDNTSRAVSQVLEKSVSYFADSLSFDDVMRQTVLDRLLAGRGTTWVRYVPAIEGDELYSEDVVVDYVYYKDFGHVCARVWQDVRAVWRRIYKTRQELAELFPDLPEEQRLSIPLDAKSSDKEDEVTDKACIYEIWDKNTKKVYFISTSCDFILKEVDDPLKLKDFFP